MWLDLSYCATDLTRFRSVSVCHRRTNFSNPLKSRLKIPGWEKLTPLNAHESFFGNYKLPICIERTLDLRTNSYILATVVHTNSYITFGLPVVSEYKRRFQISPTSLSFAGASYIGNWIILGLGEHAGNDEKRESLSSLFSLPGTPRALPFCPLPSLRTTAYGQVAFTVKAARKERAPTQCWRRPFLIVFQLRCLSGAWVNVRLKWTNVRSRNHFPSSVLTTQWKHFFRMK